MSEAILSLRLKTTSMGGSPGCSALLMPKNCNFFIYFLVNRADVLIVAFWGTPKPLVKEGAVKSFEFVFLMCGLKGRFV